MMITTWVMQLITGAGGGAVVALALFKFFGERWLDAKSKARAAADKHVMDREIEDLKARIQRQFDRVTKLSQREFEVLPEVWKKIVDAFSATENAFMRIQRHIDLSRLPEPEVVAILNAVELPDSVQQAILTADGFEKNRLYGRALRLIEIGETRTKVADSVFTLARSGIFLPEAIHAELSDLVDLIWRTIVEVQLDAEERGSLAEIPFKERTMATFASEGKARLAAAERLVRNRLQSADLDG